MSYYPSAYAPHSGFYDSYDPYCAYPPPDSYYPPVGRSSSPFPAFDTYDESYHPPYSPGRARSVSPSVSRPRTRTRAPGYGRCIIGPVIGLVTHDSARIMVEMDADMPVTCTLSVAGRAVTTGTAQALANRPVVVVFRGELQPETRYDVTFEGFSHPPSGFRTFPVYPTLAHRLNFAIIACNKVRTTHEKVTKHTDVWGYCARQARAGEIDLALHLGDQIYGDDDYEAMQQGKKGQEAVAHCKFAQAQNLLKGIPISQWGSRRSAIVELYRDQYRETWGHPPTRLALANMCNIMMYDDHEIRDDLGDKPDEFDPRSPVKYIAEAARVTCFEYQRQLYEDFDLRDPNNVPKVQRENHLWHKMGEYGIFMVDSRGAKTFNRVEGDPRPYLTSSQWSDIYSVLSPQNGAFDDCKLLIFVTQIPIIFFPRKTTERIAKKADDFEGMWAYKNNEKEQIEMLHTLLRWKDYDPYRQVVLTGGDVHLGGYSDVFYQKRFAFKQLITGPVSNDTIGNLALSGTSIINEAFQKPELAGGYSFNHYSWTNKRNYGLIRCAPSPLPIPGRGMQPYFEMSHVIAQKTGVKELMAPPSSDKGSGGCTIM